jgi:hypothetical protein
MADPTPGNIDADTEVDSGVTSGELNVHLLNRHLADAEMMLNYAVETGLQVGDIVYRSILEAGAAARTGWTEHAATDLLKASTQLAAALKPVSPESLRSTANYRSKFRGSRLALQIAMGILAAVIVFYSTLAFLFSSFSANIRNNLSVANPLAVRLVSELGEPTQSPDNKLCLNSDLTTAAIVQGATNADPSKPPVGINRKDVIEDLQTFAAAIRDMYGGARRMNYLYRLQPDPFYFDKPASPNDVTKMLELPPGLPNLALAATERVCVYQRARYYAQSTEESATILTGAVATCILPVLYAVLGAGAFVLRRLEIVERQLRLHTFTSEAVSPRFITAAIAGAVVGLFNFGSAVSVSPLAIAFLAGYAVDVFFSFLESMIETLRKGRGSAGSDQATPGGKQ